MWNRKEFCKITGCTPDALRHYEKLGLLIPARKENNYRDYGENDYRKVKYIVVLQYAGFSLKEIKGLLLLDNLEVGEECQNETTKIFLGKIRELEEKIKIYQHIVKTIHHYMEKRDQVLDLSPLTVNNFTDDMVEQVFNFLNERNLR